MGVGEWEKGEGGSKGGRVRERGVKCAHHPWARIIHEVHWLSMGASSVKCAGCPWACIVHGHISSMSAYWLWVGGSLSSVGAHRLWVHMVCSWGGSSFVVAGCCHPWVGRCHLWVVGKGVVVPMHCHLHGQAPVHGCWVPFVGTGHCSWALGPLQVVGCGPWGSFMCG